MPRYIAIHPGSFKKRDLKRLVQRHDEIPEDVLWNRTWSGIDEPITFCDWEAVSEEAVAGVFAAFRVPYDAIHQVCYFCGDDASVLDRSARNASIKNRRTRRFIAVHPDSLTEEPLKELVRRWRDLLPEDVLWRCAWAGMKEQITFCDWQAPSAEAIAYVLGRTGVPYEALYEVRYFDRRLSVVHDPERPLVVAAAV